MSGPSPDFYRTAGPMTTLPDDLVPDDIPVGVDELRRLVQGVLVHRDWAAAYGLGPDEIRLDEQNLRSTADVLARVAELSPTPLTQPRPPVARVLGICRHFTLLHTALLRARGVPARVRCGFSSYFDRTRWYDHWITERWDGERWVRDDPQIDDLQAAAVRLDFDPRDVPAGRFLSGGEAWAATRAGGLDPDLFGIFDMWGRSFIAGNVVSDFACLNKVELLPWDGWGMMTGPYEPVPDDAAAVLDDVAALAAADDTDLIRDRYRTDDRLRVPADITTVVDGRMVDVHIDL